MITRIIFQMDIESKVKNNKKPNHFVWLDLEMTGLDTRVNRIVEVGLIITDKNFNEVASYEAVIHQSEDVLKASNPFSLDTHSKNGLYAKVRASKVSEEEAESAVVKLIQEHVEEGAVFLAGNSIRADRFFIDCHWPKLSSILHYRMLDVSSLKLLWYALGKETPQKQEKHRALDDIRNSIAELQFYMQSIKF